MPADENHPPGNGESDPFLYAVKVNVSLTGPSPSLQTSEEMMIGYEEYYEVNEKPAGGAPAAMVR